MGVKFWLPFVIFIHNQNQFDNVSTKFIERPNFSQRLLFNLDEHSNNYCESEDVEDLCDQLWKDMMIWTSNITSADIFRAIVSGSIFHDSSLSVSFYRSEQDLDEMYIYVKATNYEYCVECSARMVWNLPMFKEVML